MESDSRPVSLADAIDNLVTSRFILNSTNYYNDKMFAFVFIEQKTVYESRGL